MFHPAFVHSEHRPWPPPRRPWMLQQTWTNVLSMHWPVAPSALKRFVPSALELQEHDDTGWLSVIALQIEAMRFRALPSLPGLSTFPQLNLRTYVQCEGKPGVWFLRVDADNPLAAWGARELLHLPYVFSSIMAEESDGAHCFTATRKEDDTAFRARYRPRSESYESPPGSLAHVLMERYCQYSLGSKGQLLRTELHHQTWPLHDVDVDVEQNTLFASHALDAPAASPSVALYTRRLEAVIWNPTSCKARRRASRPVYAAQGATP